MAHTRLRRLVTNPRETLDTEYKPWIDLDIPEGQAILVKTCLGLRNHGGGRLVIGFRDRRGTLDPLQAPQYDVREKFSGDSVSRLVGRYSLRPFATAVYLLSHRHTNYPVIEIASGIRTPVVAKKSILGVTGVVLLVKNVVYVRTLEPNGTASTAIAGRDDWEHMMEVCHANRGKQFAASGAAS
jgi:hypothetical protein